MRAGSLTACMENLSHMRLASWNARSEKVVIFIISASSMVVVVTNQLAAAY